MGDLAAIEAACSPPTRGDPALTGLMGGSIGCSPRTRGDPKRAAYQLSGRRPRAFADDTMGPTVRTVKGPPSMSMAFLVTSLAIIATPGTGAILTISAGLRSGHRKAWTTAFGCTLGILPHLLAAITGTAALLAAGGVAFEALKIAGMAYLLYMAWAACRDTGILALTDDTPPASSARTILNAVLANLLNPKLTLFFFAFLPQFVIRGEGELIQMLTLSAVFMVLTLIVFALYGWFASAMRRHVITRPRIVRRLQRVFSLSYLALSARLATVER